MDSMKELCELLEKGQSTTREGRSEVLRQLPRPHLVAESVDFLTRVLFPNELSIGPHPSDSNPLETFKRQVHLGLHSRCPLGSGPHCQPCEDKATRAVGLLLEQLPEIQQTLQLDVEESFRGDPAAQSRDEIILCYPGLRALTHYRIAHCLDRLGIPLIPRIISERAHAETGIDIHPGASLDAGILLDHGTGIVIGETSCVGRHVRIYQGVTLGAKKLPPGFTREALRDVPRHPIVEDDVVIYANATLLGRIRVGRGSTIGGNVWITRDVPPGSVVSQAIASHRKFEQGGGI